MAKICPQCFNYAPKVPLCNAPFGLSVLLHSIFFFKARHISPAPEHCSIYFLCQRRHQELRRWTLTNKSVQPSFAASVGLQCGLGKKLPLFCVYCLSGLYLTLFPLHESLFSLSHVSHSARRGWRRHYRHTVSTCIQTCLKILRIRIENNVLAFCAFVLQQLHWTPEWCCMRIQIKVTQFWNWSEKKLRRLLEARWWRCCKWMNKNSFLKIELDTRVDLKRFLCWHFVLETSK